MFFILSSSRSLRRMANSWSTADRARFVTSYERLVKEAAACRKDFGIILGEDASVEDIRAVSVDFLHNSRVIFIIFLVPCSDHPGIHVAHSHVHFTTKDQLGLLLPALLPQPQEASGRDVDEERLSHVLIGSSDIMRKLRQLIIQIGRSGCNCLICGESGSGKEDTARAVAGAGGSSRTTFMNCAALGGDGLVDSHLFGYKKGAFTGAYEDSPGILDAADGGSLLLDELEELPPRVQAKLLRVLDGHGYNRIGEADRERQVNFRVIGMSNKSVISLRKEGRMRPDFFMRIACELIELPPLREHPEDIGEIVRHHEALLGYEEDPIQDLDSLMAYSWPGNVRELVNAIGMIHRRGKAGARLESADFALSSRFEEGLFME